MGDIDTTDIKKFIDSTIKTVAIMRVDDRSLEEKKKAEKKDGDKDWQHHAFILSSPLTFELAVGIKKGKGGKLNMFIVDIEGKYEKETLSTISFSFDSVANKTLKLYSNL